MTAEPATDRPGGRAWRAERARRLLAFARGSVLEPHGFGWLTEDGSPDPDRGPELWINARMTYVFARAHAAGEDAAYDVASHGVRALAGPFHDDEHGGWFAALDRSGRPVHEQKTCYEHAFVLLAAAAAADAGIEGAMPLLDEAGRVHADRFWDPAAGACVEQWSRDWTGLDPYRGANSNMHAVEAYLLAADVTGDDAWRDRALRIASLLVDGHARARGWRLPEHYDAQWHPLPEYNADRPADPFRPYGATPGHALEWSRLLVQLSVATDGRADWLVPAARHLFDRAVADAVTDAPGIPYTTDWSGRPVVAERFHWVMAEAVQTAEVLAAEALAGGGPGEPYTGLRDRWWAEIDRFFLDDRNGSWRHELSPTAGPSSRTWRGRPDAYHAWNALTLGPPRAAAPGGR